jgi:uncharacterized protein YndB with AHSA1/START domain
MTSAAPRVAVATTIRAPRDRVFDAWLDPDRLARFLCAGDTHVARIEVDPRVGGMFRVVMASERGEFDHRGRYVEIVRPERLRFTWISAATGGAETDVTVTFDLVGEGTRVTMRSRRHDDQTGPARRMNPLGRKDFPVSAFPL